MSSLVEGPPWTVRNLMILVAVLALWLGLSIGIGREMERKRHCDGMVQRHLQAATRLARSLKARVADDGTIRFDDDEERREAETRRPSTLRNAEYHARWAREFGRLAWRPWAELPPDPPDHPPDD
jgi:hypothetical protein